ncbi:MAG: DUF2797 domain-containing protein [Pseudobacteriovorax sp.]|nr:DUF2797 domain-containing protein [Pseudobacteriovorax sp.]
MTTLKIRKMPAQLKNGKVQYFLDTDKSILLNEFLGAKLSFSFTGKINCIACDRSIKKTFNQGHCFPCFQSLASCDSCIVKPETCHFHKGTCREPDWGQEHCFQDHTIYLANSSGLKVGITRGINPNTRWIDQGATAGIIVGTVKDRLTAGKVEVSLKKQFADKTNWRKMLSSDPEEVDLVGERKKLLEDLPDLVSKHLEPSASKVQKIKFPILQYPEKVKSHNFDKTPEVSGVLHGIKGQYVILDSGVLNLRKFSGYQVAFDAS